MFSAGFFNMQVVRQQEMLYDVDFRLQVMERHVARASGVRSDEETKKLNAKIAKLTQVLDGVNAEHTMLAAQVKKAEEDLSECCVKAGLKSCCTCAIFCTSTQMLLALPTQLHSALASGKV